MNKLLSANFMRLKKSKIFWCCMIFMVILALIGPIGQYFQAQKYASFEPVLDGQLFTFAMFIGIVLSTFCGLFLGIEYGDGTIRNKVVVGHKRSSIYLANLITCIAAGLAMCAAFMLVYVAVGIPLIGTFTLEIKYILLYIGAAFLMSTAFASIFTMLAMLNQNKAVVAVSCILFAFISLFAGQYIQSRLEAPEMYEGYSYTDDSGELIEFEATKNPRYLEGAQREAYEFVHKLLPGDQQVQIGQMTTQKPGELMIYSAGMTVVVTAIGMMLFKKKDLK